MSNIIGSDLFVIQRTTGQLGTYKVKADDLATFVGSSVEAIVYEGQRDFNSVLDDPQPGKGGSSVIDPLNNGTMLMHNGSDDVQWRWADIDPDLVADSPNGEVLVSYGDRCIWDGSHWELIKASGNGSGTITAIKSTEPITVDDGSNGGIGSAAEPIVEIKPAQRTDNSSNIDKLALAGTGGAVIGLATAADVSAGGGNDFAAVTADLLRTTNERIDNIDGTTGDSYVTTVDKGTTGAGNSALTINPTFGDVKIDVDTISEANPNNYGVVSWNDIVGVIADEVSDGNLVSSVAPATGAPASLLIPNTSGDVTINVLEATETVPGVITTTAIQGIIDSNVTNGDLVSSVTAATSDAAVQALTISPTSGDVVIDIKPATDTTMGVVSNSDIETIIDEYAKDGNVVGSLEEGDDYQAYPLALQFSALNIKPADAATGVVEINVKPQTFLPYNFKDLLDLPAANP